MNPRPGEAYANVLGSSEPTGDTGPSNSSWSERPLLSSSALSPEAVAEAEARQKGRADYTFELPEPGTVQRHVWDVLVADGFIDPTAVPGSARFPIFEKEGRAPPPPGAAWVDLQGNFHPPEGAYGRVEPSDPPGPAEREAPFSLSGTIKSGLSGFTGTVYGTAVGVDPLNPHGMANHVESATALVGLALRDTGRISDDQYRHALAAEADFRHRIPFGLGATTDEYLHATGLYHDPQNAIERYSEDIGAQLPYALAPEAAELGVAQRTVRMAERAVMRKAEQEAAYGAGRAVTRAARFGVPFAGSAAGRATASWLGRDEADQNAAAAIGGGLSLYPFELGPRPTRFGDRWDLKTMPADQVFDLSTKNLPPDAIPSTITAMRQNNAYSYFVDGMTVRPTKGQLRAAAQKKAATERAAAEARGEPYVYQVGHSPDAALSGEADSMMPWIDQHPKSNAAVGGALGQRIGDDLRVFKVDGVAHGLPSRYDGMAYHGLMGGPLQDLTHEDRDQ